MKAFLKKWWPAFVVGGLIGLIIWRAWPRTVRKITFTDLPLIIGGGGDSIVSDGATDGAAHGDDIDDLINNGLADYDRA